MRPCGSVSRRLSAAPMRSMASVVKHRVASSLSLERCRLLALAAVAAAAPEGVASRPRAASSSLAARMMVSTAEVSACSSSWPPCPKMSISYSASSAMLGGRT